MADRSSPYLGKGGFGNKGKGKSKGEPVSEPVDENEMTLAEYAEYVKGKGKATGSFDDKGKGKAKGSSDGKGKGKDGSGIKGKIKGEPKGIGKQIGNMDAETQASFLRLRNSMNQAILSESFNPEEYDLSPGEFDDARRVARQQLNLD